MPHHHEAPHVSLPQGGTLLKRQTLISCFVCVLGLTTLAQGQAIPTASRLGSIQFGVGGTLNKPDFGQTNMEQITFYGDLDLQHHIGLEGTIHYSVNTPDDVSENTYLVGPRFVVRHKRIDGYAKALFGAGHFGLQAGSFADPNTSTYFVYVIGAGVDVRVARHINIRAFDFEFQKWPTFGANGLTPMAGTIGVAYVFR